MLHHALSLELVTLPGLADFWPKPLSLAAGLSEVLLIEGVKAGMSEPFLEVAATLISPVMGRVRHWGLDAATLHRDELYHLRSRIGYISPRQMLLRSLSLKDNLTLAPRYHQGYTESEVLDLSAELLERLELTVHLQQFPARVAPTIYHRAVWARELIKQPELILASIFGEMATLPGATLLVPVLQDYLARQGAAAIVLGDSLESFYSLGHRILRLDAGQLQPQPILGHRARPLTAFLPLV
jgi:ABC-type ATPase involved in cell division